MKKSTYAVIGFLAFTIVASVGAVCLCVYHALAGDKIDRVERVEKEISATGKLIEFGTENCREINFSGSQYGLNDLLATLSSTPIQKVRASIWTSYGQKTSAARLTKTS